MLGDRKVDVDEIWNSLGRYGRFQRFQMGIFLYGVMFNAHYILSVVFIGYVPEYECEKTDIGNLLPVDGNWSVNGSYTTVYRQCEIEVYLNDSNQTHITSTPCVGGYKYSIHKSGSFVTEWDLVCDKMGMSEVSQTILMVGKGVGALILPQVTDKYGRKKIYCICLSAVVVTSVATGLMPNFTAFLAMRFLMGMAESGQVLAGYILNLEMFPHDSRMYVEIITMGCGVTSYILLGIAAYLLRNLSWRYLQIIIPLGSAHIFFIYWIMDESLRWLIANGKFEEAEKVLRKAARWNKVKYEDVVKRAQDKANEIEAMNKDDEPSSKEATVKNYTMLTILKDKRIFLNSLIIWFLWVTVTLVYYGLTLASSTMLAGDRFVNYILLGIIEYPVVVMELFLFERIGRKKLSMGIYGVAAVSLLGATFVSAFSEGTGAEKATLALSLIGKFGVSGAFSVLFLYTPEIYPTNMRNVGMGTAMLMGRIGAMIAPFLSWLGYYVMWGPGVVFGVMCFLATLLVSFLPETTGRELPTTIDELKRWHRGKNIKRLSVE